MSIEKKSWWKGPWPWFIAIGVIQIGLAISAFLGIGQAIERGTGRGALDIQLSFIAVHAIILGVGLAAATVRVMSNLDVTTERIGSAIANHAEVRLLSADDFHDDFARAVKAATSRILITNMTPDPSYFQHDVARKEYFREHVRKIRKSRAPYRRIHRWTQKNENWLREQIVAFEGRSNASMAILSDSSNSSMGLALSVQVIDNDTTWLVAVEQHNPPSQYRDIMIRDRGFAELMGKYHERLWQLSRVVVSDGVITKDGEKFLNGTLRV